MAILKNKILYVLNDNNTYEVFCTVDNEVFLTADVFTDVYNHVGTDYYIAVTSPVSKRVVRIYLLNPDETLNRDISEYISDWSLDFTYQQGMISKGNFTLMNYDNEWHPSPLKNGIWKGTKFKIEIGIYHNKTVFWKNCGIYVCGDINLDFSKSTIDIPIYDKFAMLDGTVSGKRASSFSIPVGTRVKEAIELCLNIRKDDIGVPIPLSEIPDMSTGNIEICQNTLPEAGIEGRVYRLMPLDIYYYCIDTKFVELLGNTFAIGTENIMYRFNGFRFIPVSNEIFDSKPVIFPFKYIDALTPYTITADENCIIGDIIIELADMISCDVSYNSEGNLTLVAGAVTNDDLANNTVLWTFEDDDNFHTRPKFDLMFSKIANQVIVAGSIEQGKQYKATIVNSNPKSQVNIQMIAPSPLYIEDSNLVGVECCVTRGRYEMIKQGRLGAQISFQSIYVPHFECNKLIFFSDKKVGLCSEKFIVNSISFSNDMLMSLKVSNVNEVSFL